MGGLSLQAGCERGDRSGRDSQGVCEEFGVDGSNSQGGEGWDRSG